MAEPDLPGPAKCVALVISTRADVETGVVPEQFSPSLGELSTLSGFSPATVKRHLLTLEAAGWLKRARSGAGRNAYAVAIPHHGSERAISQSVIAQSEPAQSEPAHSEPSDSSERASDQLRVSHPYKEVHQVHQSIEEPSASAAPPPAEKPPAKKGTRLPADFCATPKMIDWARQETPLVGAKETAAFIDYWSAQPGQRGVKLDWEATWRNWMRRAQADAAARAQRGQPRASPPSTAPKAVPRELECPKHRGQRAESCRACESEKKGARR